MGGHGQVHQRSRPSGRAGPVIFQLHLRAGSASLVSTNNLVARAQWSINGEWFPGGVSEAWCGTSVQQRVGTGGRFPSVGRPQFNPVLCGRTGMPAGLKQAAMRRLVFATAACYFLALFVISVVYPIPSALGLTYHPASHWLVVYSEMALLLTCVAMSVSFIVIRVDSLSHKAQSVLGALVTLGVLAVYGVVFGRSRGLREAFPLEGMNAHFLGEFMSIKFVFVLSPMVSVLVAALIVSDFMRIERPVELQE